MLNTFLADSKTPLLPEESTIIELFLCKFHFATDWEISAAYHGVKVTVPSKFIIGDQDWCLEMFNKDYILGDEFKKDVPLLEDVVVIRGAAHFINQEKPDEINKHIIDFLRKF
ncbi:hypothetical protein L1987_77238 [Smallanthus sonchifolius]|uniref:Uncharacterized protein n=1 Tax=Smallanthus sonchifolius TaxID=185202 RepID=A0ACB8Z8F6_9ASTR|nr:hypothetical protein L1987_77238 [Smallanthus sonchifolius]